MRSILLSLVLLTGGLSAMPAHAASCWAVTGWSSTNYVGAQALLSSVSCTTIPLTTVWVQVTLAYGTPPNDDLWLRIPLTDSHISNGQFQPLLVFSHYDANNKPVVQTDLLVCTGCTNALPLVYSPPVQGTPVAGAKVRLRHRNTGKCMYSINQDGSPVYNTDCSNAASQTYVLDNAGSGYYRLRHEQSNQCLYAVNSNGASLYNWGCWNDPNMRFRLVPSQGGYRLEHLSTSQCPFGNPLSGGPVRTWGCWDDPNMVYFVDIIQNGTIIIEDPIDPPKE